ncbi:MAG: PLP-dependent transferase, partial [Ktedonobacterales bacterium]
LVMHSATKYLNGHSDVVAGALVTREADAHWAAIRAVRAQHGGILGAFEAWLLLRGMRTLYVRVPAACRAAQRIAERMATHPRIGSVLYPGLPAAPGHAIAARQMQGGFGGMLSIRVRGGEAAAIATAARVRLWKRATSLGGVESLIEHRASIEGPQSRTPRNLLRLSIGLEHPDDLIEDLAHALE